MDLAKEKMEILEKIKTLDGVIKGSICELKRFCGKKNCICYKNHSPHKSLFLSFKYKGKTKLIPIKKKQIPRIKIQLNNYKELKQAIDDLAKINAELLRKKEEK